MHLDSSHLGSFPQIYVEDRIDEHVAFIHSQFWLYLRLKVARRSKKLFEVFLGFGNEVVLIQSLVWNIDDLQEPGVGETLGSAGKVDKSEVKCGLQGESQVQSSGAGFDVDIDPVNTPGRAQGGNGALDIGA